MHRHVKLVVWGCLVLAVVATLLFTGGILSKPRDYSSPSFAIRIVDKKGQGIRGLEVSRNWYDADAGKEGSDSTVSDPTGTYRFSKIPARIGIFTGSWRKAYTSLGMCGSGSGTYSVIYVRFHGRCDVVPFGKSLHPAGQIYQDQDGVWFNQSTDTLSNTTVELTLPEKYKSIDYILSCTPER